MPQSPLPVSPAPALALSSQDYARMSDVISSVLDAAGVDSAQGCSYFAIIGACLLERWHGLRAQPLAGAAAFRVSTSPSHSLRYGVFKGGNLVHDGENGFHCWVHCSAAGQAPVVIDLLAPWFPEVLRSCGIATPLPRRMFQRPLSDMRDHALTLQAPGDFHLAVDFDLTQALLREFAADPLNLDVLEACKQWYRPTPQTMPGCHNLVLAGRTLWSTPLQPKELLGTW